MVTSPGAASAAGEERTMVDFVEENTPAQEAAPPAARGAPIHLWAVGGLAVLWNGFGALDYTMSQLRNRD